MARPRKQYRIDKHLRRVNGKRVESVNYNIFFRDHLQIEHRIKGTPDKSITEYLAKNLVAIVNHKTANQPLSPALRNFIESQPKKLRENLLAWGILDSNTNAGFEPLMIGKKEPVKYSRSERFNVTGGHLYYWQKSMETNERSKQHIKESIAKVARVITGCGFIVPSDITGEKFKNWLSGLRDKGKTISNVNAELTSFKAFTLWLLRTGRISENPIMDITPLKKLDKERPRRPLTQGQVNDLITATIEADKHHGLTGYERSLIYRLALSTGLRYNEIYTLKRRDIVINELKVTVQAGNAKNRKWDTLPLREELAKDLYQYFSANLGMPHTKTFSTMWKDSGAAMLKPDLELAGIEYETEDGVADFHSLRHTFGTLLARSGVSPQDAQKLMRHSDINLTMGIYTHLKLSDKAVAISKLPPIEILKPKRAKTGTADTPENFSTNFSKNPIKPYQNSAKSSRGEICKANEVKAITPCNINRLQNITATRPAGLEPAAYGLEIR